MTANIQISGKADNGMIFVVGGDDFETFRVNLVATVGNFDVADSVIAEAVKLIVPASAGEFGEATRNVQNAFPQAQPVDTRNGQAGYGYQQEQQQAPPQQRQATGPPPGQQAPTCNHGWERVFKSGTSKAGKPYKAWMCASDNRNDQCEPVWLR